MNRNNHKGILYFLSVILVILSSCLKQNIGEYDRDKIEDLDFGVGLAESYTLNVGEELNLDIDLSSLKINPEEFNFKWYYYPRGSASEDAKVEVSNVKALNLPGTLSTGNYRLILEAQNINSGVTYIKDFDLSVKRLTAEGWLLLTYDDVQTNLSIISSEGDVFKDFLVPSEKHTMRNKPAKILCLNDWDDTTQPITIITEEPQVYFLHHDTFEVIRDANEAFNSSPNLSFDYFGSDMWYNAYYLRDTDGNIYYTSRGLGEDDNFPEGFADAMLGDYVSDSFLVPTEASYPVQVIGLDIQSNRFFYQPSFAPNLEFFPFENSQPFNVNDFKDTVVFSDSGPGESAYVVGENEGAYSVYEFLLDMGMLDATPAINKRKLVAPNNVKPSHFAFSRKLPLLYFVAGNDLYLFKMTENKYEKLYTFPDSERVSSLKMFKETILQTQMENPAMENRLCMSTNSGEEGVFYMFDLSPTGMLKTGDYTERIGGFSKIVDIAYKENK